MTAATDITKAQRKILLALLHRYLPGVTVWAYGSRVKWTARPNSDLDLVAFTTPQQRPLISELTEALAESDLPFLVDLHVWDEVPERFREIIRKEYVVLQEATEKLEQRKPAEWLKTTIGQQATLQRGIDITRAEQRSGTVPVISSSGIASFHDTAQVRGPGVVLGRKGVVGSVYFIESDFWPHDTTLWVKDFHGNDPRFVYYFFKRMAPELLSMDVGSANPTLNRNHVHPIETLWPPLPEQRAIAGVLGALDDKIESNRRTSRALERLARAIFRAWFVDFEPVKAKASGARSFPGMPQEAFDSLPTRFVESELGLVPEGWEIRTVREMVEGIYDGPHATPPESETGPIFLGIKNLAGTSLDYSEIRHINEKHWAQWTRRVEPGPGDIVFSYEATLGFFALIPPGIRCCLGRRLALIRPKRTNGFGCFWFHQFISEPFQRHLFSHSIHGSTVDRTPLKEFPAYLVFNPPDTLKSVFESTVTPFWKTIYNVQAESSAITIMRDYLLPKLLSGEVRMAEAEKNE